MHFFLHGQHHKFPLDPGRLVFPPVPAAVLCLLIRAMYMLLLPTHVANAMLSGTVLGYVGYDLIHYYLHHGGTPKLAIMRRLKAAHAAHHFTDSETGT